ncbi:MAG: hypothetical protein AABY15_06985 [Nanoarchaeota archaeon]
MSMILNHEDYNKRYGEENIHEFKRRVNDYDKYLMGHFSKIFLPGQSNIGLEINLSESLTELISLRIYLMKRLHGKI